jgi:hypothetical protein
MNTRLLIDAIMQQTTVLIAQLSTAAGLRSPLAHVADEVFVSLAKEIENQGVGRKVIADMFGLALRSYQRRIQRLEESRSVRERTLWEAVQQFVVEHGPVGRRRLLDRFKNDDEPAVLAVLKDLVRSGLLYSSGRGEATVYGCTTAADRSELSELGDVESRATLVWGTLFRNPGTRRHEVPNIARLSEAETRPALDCLLADGRVKEERDGRLVAAPFVIPLDAPAGWEAAIFDHFQAVATAIGSKLQGRLEGSANGDEVGGSTLHFGIHDAHPHAREVLQTLGRIRAELDELWGRVSTHNRVRPLDDEAYTRVTFYFGQNVRRPDSEPRRRHFDHKSQVVDTGVRENASEVEERHE